MRCTARWAPLVGSSAVRPAGGGKSIAQLFLTVPGLAATLGSWSCWSVPWFLLATGSLAKPRARAPVSLRVAGRWRSLRFAP